MLLCSSLIENYFWTKASLGDRCTVGLSIFISCPIVISFLIQIKFDFLWSNCIVTIITFERVYTRCILFALSPYRDNANRDFSIWIIIFFNLRIISDSCAQEPKSDHREGVNNPARRHSPCVHYTCLHSFLWSRDESLWFELRSTI